MNMKCFFLIFVLFVFTSCNTSKEDSAEVINFFGYPESAEMIDFKKAGMGMLTLVKEIDIFDVANIPVGQIVSVDTLGDDILLADIKQNMVHVLDRETYRYKTSIGSSGKDPDQLHLAFGALSWNGEVMVGNGQGPYLFKSFSPEGRLINTYNNTEPLSWGVAAGDINNSFIADSIAYVVKQVAENGKKVARYRLADQAEKIKEELVPVSDLHESLDSATMTKVIIKMFLLKSSLGNGFYVMPSNKFLVNNYTMDGVLKSSINLMNIPLLKTYVEQIKNYANSFFSSVAISFFSSVAIDEDDNLYIPAQEILAYEAFKKGMALNPEDIDLFILSINLENKSYFVNKLESGTGKALAPLKVFDGKIWCYDYVKSQIVIYQLPKI